MEIKRKNINRGFTKLRVWEDAIDLFVLVNELTKNLTYEFNRTRSNILDASHSISRNISEGYCRKNLKEYLNFLNYSLGSCGELFSGMISFRRIDALSKENFEKFDQLHYKVENELLSLIKSLQAKQRSGQWESSFV